MTIGKLFVHIAHAAVEGYRLVKNFKPEVADKWILSGQKKVVLHVSNLDQLIKKYKKAISLGIPSGVIRDAGLTELEPGTITVLVIGPWFSDIIDKVTGDLPLLRNW